ncbi:MAG TPA: cysteine desulfurase-like protein [Woeseiaceae bacterium]|nr:cysteine desulfurase-like protein [Woeseiaceae bacterium]
MGYDIDAIRGEFPSLAITQQGRPRIYFDNPAGTQVPRTVMERMTACLLDANANLGGQFETSRRADAVVDEAHAAMADFLHAASPGEIIFGQNMTSLTLHISRSLGHRFRAGDEIIVTRMDHDANIAPWLLLAEDLDLVVRWLPFDTDTFEFDLAALDDLLTERTRLVCCGGASNLLGTINDLRSICRKARDAGALSFVDAVQLAPHVAIDVQDLGCDMLTCSAYKFFGPHQGILWGRRALLESLHPYKARPAPATLPGAFETGTQSHEGMAGTTAAVNYFAWIGATMARDYHARNAHYSGRCRDVHAALDLLFDYETGLTGRLLEGLQQLPGVRVLGITDKHAMHRRVPTVAFTASGHHPAELAKALAERGIFAWNGHNFALEVVRSLDLLERGGAVRVGPVHYNTSAEIDCLLAALGEILSPAHIAGSGTVTA